GGYLLQYLISGLSIVSVRLFLASTYVTRHSLTVLQKETDDLCHGEESRVDGAKPADWSRRLTFDEIYNDTHYVQIQQRPRPYDIPDYTYNLANDFRINLEHDRRIVNNFRHSLEDDKKKNDDRRIVNIGHSLEEHRKNNEDRRILNIGHSLEELRGNRDDRRIINNYKYSSEEDNGGNEVDIEYDVALSSVVKEPLLVGFSHDPFRYSVPEDDFLKGVRNMNPKSIMSKGENRGKRGVLHLYNMMYCATGCEPLAYKGYGCYCGFLGSGRPTDGIDRCCKMHDECYENIYCPFFTVYFQPYYWKCYKGQPLCALENYHTQHQFINGCAARLCECDRRFAMCVKQYPCPRRRALCRSSPIRLLQNLLMFR
ncbi:uncharacterized protein LOC126370421, partial [Pectinophora gossypiella]|uniref:uncharacterized protein LOC126370421 n=1 Tax=Pectinophora gossypiella TaxID=13191 RepID=UPI00214E17D1